MQIARVIGSVVATRKDELLTGIKLLVIQPVDSKGNNDGSPIVAVDTVGAGNGSLVIFAKSKEGAFALPNPNACADAGITGIIDHVYRP